LTITLEITASSEARPRGVTRHVFGEEGGTIGRAPNNSWVLSDKRVSAQHIHISFRNGVFYIEDTSRNRVAVNSPGNWLERNRPYALKTGDRLLFEPYEIEVRIDAGPAAHEPLVSLFGASPDDDPFAARQQPPRAIVGPFADASLGGEVDPLKFFDSVGGRPAARQLPPSAPPADDLMHAHYEPPGALPDPEPAKWEPAGIPPGYDPLAPDIPSVASPAVRPRPGVDSRPGPENAKAASSADPPTVRQPAPPAFIPSQPARVANARASSTTPRDSSAPRDVGRTGDLAEFLAGAGVPDAAITPELSRSLGEILRIVVSGLMDVLRARQSIKEEFRMDPTYVRPADNNPLKFSANVEDALHNLLLKRNPAYLGPVDAFADAFDDLRDHQIAMLAGIRVAFESILAEFDPGRLEEEFDRQQSKSSLPLVSFKPRYWDLYRERAREMAKDPEATFVRLFGEEFRQAYEEQFRKLKAQRRGRGPNPPDFPPPLK
jgi:type VI secretion system FHA domain protein